MCALICIDLKSLPAIVVSRPHCLLSSRPSIPLVPHQGSQRLREDTQEGGSAVSVYVTVCYCMCVFVRDTQREPCPDKPGPDLTGTD